MKVEFHPEFWNSFNRCVSPWWRVWDYFTSIPRRLKWAWQRVYRGYDDTSYWELGDHLAGYIVRHLKSFKENSHAYPCNEEVKNAEHWDKILGEMIEGWEWLSKHDERHDAIYAKFHANTDMTINEQLFKEANEQFELEHSVAVRKASLMVKHLLSLWD